jgi:hypothetical protein
MVMSPDIEAQILRYHHAEKWTVGTIARQLHVLMPAVARLRPALAVRLGAMDCDIARRCLTSSRPSESDRSSRAPNTSDNSA